MADNIAQEVPSSDPARRHEPTQNLFGWITHTELASTDPDATKAWCEHALGWTFMPNFETDTGAPYHLFTYSAMAGGGIRRTEGQELPRSTPFVHVRDAHAAFQRAIDAGAQPILAPTRVMDGVTTAIVQAPGGLAIGFSGP